MLFHNKNIYIFAKSKSDKKILKAAIEIKLCI
jgi:hypothetical protein